MAAKKKVQGVDIENKLSFNTNISGLQQAKSALEDIQKKSFLELKIVDYSSAKGVEEATKKLDAAKKSASQLSSMLDAAFNKDLGKLNISAFEQQLKQSGTSLQQMYANLSAIGPVGQDAFHKVAAEVLTTNTQLQKSKTFLDEMAVTMSNTVKWGIASSAMKNFTTSVQQAYNYVKNLDYSLNQIRIVSGQSADQMDKFAIKANASAKALGAATRQYTDASLIYFQQGLGMEEATQRTDVTIKMSNALGESASKVSDYMTAIWNNFDDGSQSLEYFGDVLAKLGASTASSAEEIAEGLDKFAAVSNTVGLSYEYATTALATVVAETRQSADVVGTAFKTLFARIQDLELGKTLDDDTTLGTYSQALDAVGINIKQQNGELKDMDDILNEMGAKWKTLGKDQQVALAQTVAGVRQYTQLIALMDNWDIFNQNLKTAQTSAGTLNKQQAIYMESVDAHTQQLKTSWEELYSALGDNKAINAMLDGLTHAVELLDNFVDSVGGGAGVLKLLGSVGLRVFDKQLSGGIARLIQNFNQAKNATKELEAQTTVFNEFKMINDGSDAYKNLISMVEQRIKYQDLISKNELEDINNIIKAKAEQDRLLESIENTAKAAEKFKELSGEKAKLGSSNGIGAEKGRLLGKVEAAGLNAPAKKKSEERESIIDAVSEISRKFDVDSSYKISGDESARTAMQRFWESYGDQQKASEKLLPLKEALGENSEEFQNLSALIDKARVSLSQFVNQSGSVVEDSSKLKEYESAWDAVYDAVDQLKNNIGDAKAIINQSADAMVDNLSNEQNKLKDVATSASQKLGADYSNIINEKETQRKAQNIADLTSGIISLSMAITQVQNLGSIWDNDDLTFGEKLLQTVMSLGIAFGQLSSAMKLLKSEKIMSVFGSVKDKIQYFNKDNRKSRRIDKKLDKASDEDKKREADKIRANTKKPINEYNRYLGQTKKRFGIDKNASYEDTITELEEKKSKNQKKINQEKGIIKRTKDLEKIKSHEEEINEILKEQEQIESTLVTLNEKKEEASKGNADIKEIQGKTDDEVLKNAAAENEDVLDALTGGEIDSERLSKFTEKFHELGGGIKGVAGGLKAFIGPEGAVMLAVASITWAVNRVKQYYADLKEQADETSSRRNEEAEQTRELTQANKDNAKSYIELEQAKATMDYDEYTKQHAELIASLGTEAAKLDVLINKYKQYGQSAEDAQNTALKVYSAQQAQSTKQKDVTAGRAATYAIGQDVREKNGISYSDKKGILSISELGNENNPLLKAIGKIDGISDPEHIKLPSDPEKFVKMVNAIEDAYNNYGEAALNNFSDGYAEKIREALNAIESSDSWANAQSAITDIEMQNMDIAAADEATGWTATGAHSSSQAKKNYDEYIKRLQGQGYSSGEASKMAQQYFSQSGTTSYDQEMANYQTTLEKVALSGTKSYYWADQVGEDRKQEWWSEGSGEEVKKIVSEAYANNMQDLFDMLSDNEIEALVSGKANLTDLWNKYNDKLSKEYWEKTGKAISEAGDNLANKLASGDIDASEILTDEDYKKLIDAKSNLIKYSGDSSKEVSNLYDILENTALSGTDQFQYATEKLTDISYQKTLTEKQSELNKSQNELEVQLKLGDTKKFDKDYQDTLTKLKANVKEKSNEIAAIEQKHLNNLKKRMSSVSSELDNIQSSYSSLKDVVKDYNSDGKITLDNLQSLLTMSDDYLACLEMQNGQLVISKNKMIDLVNARLDEAEANAYDQLQTQLTIIAQQKAGNAAVETAGKVSILNAAMRDGVEAAKASEAEFSSWAASLLSTDFSSLSMNDKNVQDAFQVYQNKIKGIENVRDNLSVDFDSIMSGGTDTQADMKEYEVDKYEKINRIIEKLTRNIQKLQDAQDKLVGADLLSNLNQQTEVLEEQNKAYEKKLELQKEEAASLRSQLSGWGATFDQDSNINYNAFMVDITNAANAGSISDDQYERYKEAADKYKQVWESDIHDVEDSIQETASKLAEIELEKLNVKVNMQLDTSDAERQYNEWYNKVVQKATRAFGSITNVLTGELAKKNVQTYMDDTVAWINKFAETKSLYNRLSQGDTSVDQSKLLDDLKEASQGLMSAIESIENEYKNVIDAYLSSIDTWSDALDKINSDYESINSQLNHAVSLTKLLFGDDSYSTQNQYLSKVIANSQQQLIFAQQQVTKFQEKMNQALAKNDDELYEKYKEKYTSWLSSMNSILESTLQNIQTKYTNSLSQIFTDFEKKILGTSLDKSNEEWDRLKTNAGLYLDKVNRAYEITKLQAKYTKQLNSTSNIDIQNKINKVMQAQVKALQAKTKLSKYDVDLANAKYETLVAEIALQEAQANKTKMQLQRDSQGNYSYVYSQDEDTIADAQSKLEEARVNEWNIIKEKNDSIVSDFSTQMKNFEDALKKAYTDNKDDPQTRETEIKKVISEFKPIFGGLGNQWSTARDDMAEWIASDKGISVTSVTDDMIKGYYPNWNNNMIDMLTKLGNSNSFEEMANQIAKEANEKTAEYQTQVNEILNIAKTSLADIKNGIYGDGGDSELSSIKAKDERIAKAAETNTNKLETLKNTVAEKYNDFMDKYGNLAKSYLKQSQEWLKKINDTTQKYQKSIDSNVSSIKSAMSNVTNAIKNSRVTEKDIKKAVSDAIKDYTGGNETTSNKTIKNDDTLRNPLTDNGVKVPTSETDKRRDLLNQLGQTTYHTDDTKAPESYALSSKNATLDSDFKQSNVGLKFYQSNVPIYWNGKGSSSSVTDGYFEYNATIGNEKLFIFYKNGKKMGYYRWKNGALYPNDTAQQWGDHNIYKSYDTGGYTGDWSGSTGEYKNGRWSLLHPKELVLNKDDTKNFLTAIEGVRNMSDIISMLDSYSKARYSMIADNIKSPNINTTNTDNSSAVTQNIAINADFSGLHNAQELENAIDNLSNKALQYAYKTI